MTGIYKCEVCDRSCLGLTQAKNCCIEVKIERLRAERDKWKERCESLANFNPDWDMLEATQESLRGHMRTIKKLNDGIDGLTRANAAMIETNKEQAQRIAELEDEIALTKELHAAILDLIGSEGMTDAKFVRWVETAIAKEQDDDT